MEKLCGLCVRPKRLLPHNFASLCSEKVFRLGSQTIQHYRRASASIGGSFILPPLLKISQLDSRENRLSCCWCCWNVLRELFA